MKFLHSNNIKKISASIFMALFVFVHAVKTFHTHEYFSAQTQPVSKHATNISQGFFCAICDFQLAKDSDAEVASVHITAPVKNITPHYCFIVKDVSTTSQEFSSRGPPSMA